jgi:hypothetical protein
VHEIVESRKILDYDLNVLERRLKAEITGRVQAGKHWLLTSALALGGLLAVALLIRRMKARR